jgi:hypothetical protein
MLDKMMIKVVKVFLEVILMRLFIKSFCSLVFLAAFSFINSFSMAQFFKDKEVKSVVEQVCGQLVTECWKVISKASTQNFARSFEGLGSYLEGKNPEREKYEDLIKNCLSNTILRRLGKRGNAERFLAADFCDDYEGNLDVASQRISEKVFYDLCVLTRGQGEAGTPFLNFLRSDAEIETRHMRGEDDMEVDRPITVTQEIQRMLEDEIRLKLDGFIRWLRQIYLQKQLPKPDGTLETWGSRQVNCVLSRDSWRYRRYFLARFVEENFWQITQRATSVGRCATYLAPGIGGAIGYLSSGPVGAISGICLGSVYLAKALRGSLRRGVKLQDWKKWRRKCEVRRKIATKRRLKR